jgi:CRP-like cAMP-binding protein
MTPRRLSFDGGPVGAIAAGPLANLSSVLEFKMYDDGAVVVQQGEETDWLGVVLDGVGVVERQLHAGDPDAVEILATVARGDIIGEMAFVDRHPRSATIRARGRLYLARLHRADFRTVMSSDPDTAEVLVGTLLSTLTARLRDSDDHQAALYEVGRQLGLARSAEDVGVAVLQYLAEAIEGTTVGLVAVFDPTQGGRCFPVVSFGLPSKLEGPLDIDQHGSFIGMLRKAPAAVAAAADEPELAELTFAGAHWWLASTIINEEKLIGFIALGSLDDESPFLPQHEVLLAVLANQVSAAMARYLE